MKNKTMKKADFNIADKTPLPRQKWLAVVFCVWMTLAMLIGYILFEGPVFSSLDKIDAYAAFQQKLSWIMGENPKPLPPAKGDSK